ncbi:MAG: helicase-related protein [Thaumarchaeota archaeon]|nr:helicase-related protein [Nitrososphaerota archaeon]
MYVSRPLIYDRTVEDREYQRAISEAAKDRNSLVVLPTALGKTVISALVVADLLYTYRDKRVLVMAPTRPLCMQHMSSFRKVMRLPDEEFVLLTGKTPADFREITWNGRSRLVFATPEVVRNDLLSKKLTLKDFGLLVFDECHRSVKEYAYTEIASQYVKTSGYPLILGMTASPGADVQRVKMVCESLFIEHVEYRSDEDPDVTPYIHPIAVDWKTVELPAAYQRAIDLLNRMLDERTRWLKGRGYLKGRFDGVTRMQLIELGAELRYSAELSMEEETAPIYGVIARQASALTILHMLELLEAQGPHTLKAFMERMEGDEKRSRSALLKEPAYAEVRSLLEGGSLPDHPKVGTLAKVMGQLLAANEHSRILVFTQYRDTATHLVETLNSVKGVRAERFVGQAKKLGDPGLSQEKQASLIGDFRKGYLNTLVATSIAEEGLDIPEVDMVVFYEPVPSEIRHIQRRGRTGRKTAGNVVILVANGSSDTFYVQASALRVERMREITTNLNELLKPVLRTKERPLPMPMTADDMARLPGKPVAEEDREGVQISAAAERESAAEVRKEMVRAAKQVYLRILEMGDIGVSDEALYREFDEEGYSPEVVRLALGRLAKAKHIASSKGKSSIPARAIPGAQRMSIEVERLVAGHAIVWVDEKWRAKLLPENYGGPRELIKKGSKFEAVCSLYDEAGTLCVNVRQVVRRD